MLTNLHVQNLAIINVIDIEFKDGLTAITGETGAGKSLIIDAIGLLTGARSSGNLVRTGENKAVIEGTFENVNKEVYAVLKECGIEDEDPIIILRRDIYSNGKSIFRVNGLAVSLAQAELICDNMIDIHVQHDTLRLFDPKNYLSFIDDDETNAIINDYQIKLNEYLDKLKNYKNLEKKNQDTVTNLDYLKYQVEELKRAHLKSGEKEAIEEEIHMLSNYENIFQYLNQILGIIQDNNLRESLHDISNYVKKLASLKSNYKDYLPLMDDAYYNLDDLEATIQNDLLDLEFDENHLNNLNERLSELGRLTKKYHKNEEELIDYLEQLKKDIDSVENIDVYLEDALKEVKNSYNSLKEVSIKLTNVRKHKVEILRNDIIATLKELMLEKVRIEIPFNEVKYDDPLDDSIFNKNGVDEIDIYISFNPGEGLRPLSKSASGGEMSRVMLSLKANLFKNKGLSTVIFDEIDTGMSGIVAKEVAKKLKEMSKNMQVFAITHLPIVASVADTQLYVTKDVSGSNTFTNIYELNFDERIEVLAQMISPNDQSMKSREVAKDMLLNK